MRSIALPAGVQSIESSAFANCEQLAGVTIPARVTSIGSSAFNGCSRLMSVVCEGSYYPTLSNGAFSNTPLATSVYRTKAFITVPRNALTLYREANGWKSYKDRIVCVKTAQSLKASGKTKTATFSKVKKASVNLGSMIVVKNAKGAVSYKKTSGNSKIAVNATSGKLTVKKGCKKGAYTINVKVNATGNDYYKPASKTVKVVVKVL